LPSETSLLRLLRVKLLVAVGELAGLSSIAVGLSPSPLMNLQYASYKALSSFDCSAIVASL